MRSSLDEGMPIPGFIVAELRSRTEDVDLVIETTEAHVRLTTHSTASARPDEHLVTLAPPVPTRPSLYPGLMLNNRLLLDLK